MACIIILEIIRFVYISKEKNRRSPTNDEDIIITNIGNNIFLLWINIPEKYRCKYIATTLNQLEIVVAIAIPI